ncbi:DUF6262 family protein [Micromonospora sp. DT4]|uniref:DUF6262 family protein n=1 Tax=Micromonospora sp. DT4 TaxID=3393438 RepID=UPI003CF4F8FD
MTASHPLTQARHRDAARRRERVHQAIAAMTAEAAEISISAVAARARVHRSFIHRHPDLHAAVVTAADPPGAGTEPGQATTTVSRRSLLADNANLHEHARRLQRRINDLEARLSELLGAHAAECSGFSLLDTADTQDEIDDLRQRVLDLQRIIEERDEELGAAREAHRRLMVETNRA